MPPEQLKTREDILAAIEAALEAGRDELVIEHWDIEISANWRGILVPEGFSLIFQNNRFHEAAPDPALDTRQQQRELV